jgi:hypothetical protein
LVTFENNRIVSKERMLEVYFNIIEWGPNVYGMKQVVSTQKSELTFQRAISGSNHTKSQKNLCISLMIKAN